MQQVAACRKLLLQGTTPEMREVQKDEEADMSFPRTTGATVQINAIALTTWSLQGQKGEASVAEWLKSGGRWYGLCSGLPKSAQIWNSRF